MSTGLGAETIKSCERPRERLRGHVESHLALLNLTLQPRRKRRGIPLIERAKSLRIDTRSTQELNIAQLSAHTLSMQHRYRGIGAPAASRSR